MATSKNFSYSETSALKQENQRLADEINYIYKKDKEKSERIGELLEENELLKRRLSNQFIGKSQREIELEANCSTLAKELDLLNCKYRKLLDIQALMAKNEELLKERLEQNKTESFKQKYKSDEREAFRTLYEEASQGETKELERSFVFVNESLRRMEGMMGIKEGKSSSIIERTNRLENAIMEKVLGRQESGETEQTGSQSNLKKIIEAVEVIEKRLAKVEGKKDTKKKKKVKK